MHPLRTPMKGSMDPARHRLTMLILAAVSYVVVTAVFVEFERPGLGLGDLF